MNSPPSPRAEGAGRPSHRAGAAVLGRAAGRARVAVTLAEASYLPPGRLAAAPTGLGALRRGSAPYRPRRPDAASARASDGARRGARRAESPGRLSRSHPFASKRFHVLLNSLFKVLFNFPSRYLSAIGLVSVFSLRWSLPPTLGCIPKQPDSKDVQRHDAECL